MPLDPGTRLGAYEIVAPLGAGGMGEVYKARDTRLDRTVAIKVLPATLAADPQFRERFDREARAISALEHPHICALYDIGQDAVTRTDFLVMQYLDGETLATRIARGPLPVAETLQHAIAIASALDEAHSRGIVHRDLKPGNIMLVAGGRQGAPQARLLDFGLAKSVPPGGALRSAEQGAGAPPTVTTPLTAQGAIVGTFQYMAPEQLEGADADTRSDIWAFGCVIYEMLTGRRAFEGRSQASLIGSIMKDEPPPLAAVQPVAPPALDHVVRRCLAKNPDDRWQHIRDVGHELGWVAQHKTPSSAVPVRARTMWPWVIAAALAGAVVTFFLARTLLTSRPAAAIPLTRFTVPLPDDTRLSTSLQPFAIAPDGSRVVFAADHASAGRRLFLRALDQTVATPVPNTESAGQPFFSPDGEWIGFFTPGHLKKAPIGGGEATTLAAISEPRGGAWTADGRIVFAPQVFDGLFSVPADGGAVTRLTTLDAGRKETTHRFPHVLPDGRIVFTISTSEVAKPLIGIVDAAGGAHRVLVESAMTPQHVATGHLLYAAVDPATPLDVETESRVSIVAVPFDDGRIAGTPIPVAGNVGGLPVFGDTMFAAARNGTFLSVEAPMPITRRLLWATRTGIESPLACPPRPYAAPRVSPDGRSIVAARRDEGGPVVLCNVERGVLEYLTNSIVAATGATWSPDGQSLAIGALFEGVPGILRVRLDTPAAVERLTSQPTYGQPTSWHRDGTIAIEELSMRRRNDIVMLPPGQPPRPFLATPRGEGLARFSRDGAWLAYMVAGDVYVQPYGGSRRERVSTSPAQALVWAPDGRHLYYQSGTQILAVPLSSAGPGAAVLLFERRGVLHDISPDGEKFLFSVPDAESPPPPMILTFGWLERALARGQRP